jgi:hypothetical protein
MKFRMIIFILAFVAVITGCTNENKGGVRKVTLDNVIQSMESKGLKLTQIHPKGNTSPFDKLNDVTATTYALDASHVNVYIYVFDSEEARIEGRKGFNEIVQRTDFVMPPSVYEKKMCWLFILSIPTKRLKMII